MRLAPLVVALVGCCGGAPEGSAPSAAIVAATEPASPQDLGDLASGDRVRQLRAARVLRSRIWSPAIQKEVDRQLAISGLDGQVREALICLRAGAPDAFAFVAQRFEETLASPSGRSACLFEALGRSSQADTPAALALLVPLALGSTHDRKLVLSALAALPVSALSPDVVRAGVSTSPYERRRAAETAVAMGATSHSPRFLQGLFADPESRVREALVLALAVDEHAGAARMLVMAEGASRDEAALRALESRRSGLRDLDGALLEVAQDASLGLEQRARAVELLGLLGDPGARRLLVPLRRDDDPTLGAYVDAALGEMDRRAAAAEREAVLSQ